MPICTITTSNKDISVDSLKNYANTGLEILLNDLSIPEHDREIRIVRGQQDGIKISFTVGGIEYPDDHPGEVFDPERYNPGIINETGNKIKEELLKSGISYPLEINTYEGSQFIVLDGSEVVEEGSLDETDDQLEGIKIRATLTISNELKAELNAQTGGNRETESGNEKVTGSLINELKAGFQELGINFDISSETAIHADAPTALDMHIDAETLGESAIERITELARDLIVRSGLNKENSTIWTTVEGGRKSYNIV